MSASEIEEERRNVEGNIKYNFREFPKAFEHLYVLSLAFPNIHQLQYYDDGRISFYIRHCQEDKEPGDYCFLLEVNDTLNPAFQILDKTIMLSERRAEEIRTDSWSAHFTGHLDHPLLPALLSQLNIEVEDLMELKTALDEAHVKVNEETNGFNKNNSMVVFGLYSMLASVDYIIPLHKDVDLDDYTKLNEHYYYGDAPTFRYYHLD